MSRRTQLLLAAAAGICMGVAPNVRATLTYNFSNPDAWTLSNGIVSLTFNSTTDTFSSMTANLSGANYTVVNSSFNMPNLNHGSPTPAIYAQDNGGGVAGTAGYQIGNGYIDIWNDDSAATSPQPGLDIQTHWVLEDNTAGLSAYTVLNHSATAQAVSGYGGDFVIKTSDVNLTQLDYTNYNVNDLGTFQANFPNMYAQAAAAAVSGRNVQAETIDYNGFTYNGQNVQSQINENYQMASGISGTVNRQYITKYDYATAAQFEVADGYVGTDGLGVWSVYPSTESLAGGPTDVNIMGVSSGPMETLGWASNHLGGASYSPPQGVNSTHIYGPFFIGLNAMPGTDLTSNLSDATALYNQEVAQIPSLTSFYNTDTELVASGYVPTTSRGTMTATVTNTGGWNANPYADTIVLSDNQKNLLQTNDGDEYWGYINPATNSISIPGVAPGTYRISGYELGQWGEMRYDNVTINSNLNRVISGLKFTPENFSTAAPVWTIGTPERSSQEFEYGSVGAGGGGRPANNNYLGAYDYWGGLASSPVPGAVVYYATAVGSTPATNNLNDFPFNYWQTFDPAEYDAGNGTTDNYANVVAKTAPYVGNPATYKGPDWQIHFAVTASQLAEGRYVDLSVGLVAAQSSLIVSLNNHTLTWHYSNISGDDPMERSGTTGYYQWIVYQWDTSDLNAVGADNVLTFGLSQGRGVMWDALRMEISPTGANPATTGWHDYEFLYNSTDTPVNDALSANNGGNAVHTMQTGASGNWTAPAGGSWQNSGNWSGGVVPQYKLDTANFGGSISAAATVNLDGNMTLGAINFNGSQSYTIAAGSGGTLAMDAGNGSAAINDLGGTHTISVPLILNSSTVITVNNAADGLAVSGPISGAGGVTIAGSGTVAFSGTNTYVGNTTVNSGTLVVGSSVALPAATNLTVGQIGTPASVQLLPGIGAASVASVTINPGSSLDITKNNRLVINYGFPQVDPAATIRGYLKSAYNGGVWTGAGLTSSSVQAQVANARVNGGGNWSIGYADGSMDPNQTVAVGSQLVILPALVGDANLDGSVTFIDLGIVAQNLGAINSDCEHGDFNYDGTTNFLDIGLLAQNLSKNLLNTPLSQLVPDPSASFTAEWNLTLAEIRANGTQPADLPEPGVGGLVVVGAAGLMGRRRKR